MDLELRRFRREFRKRGGWTLTVWDRPPSPDKTEISWTTDESGRRCLHFVIIRNSIREAFEALNSRELVEAIRLLPPGRLN
jgi:hypothetical protein